MEFLGRYISVFILAAAVVAGCSSRQIIDLGAIGYGCEWNQAGGGPSRAGAANLEFSAKPSLAWKNEIKTPLLTEPSIAADHLFLPVPNSGILILKSESGERVGMLKVGGPVTAPVAVSDSFIVYNEYGQRLVAANWVTGQRVWAVELYGSDVAPLVFDGKVFWHDGRRNITCFDLKEGKRIWGKTVDYDITAPPAACSLGVLFASNEKFLECLSPSDGRLIWSMETGSRVKTAPVISGDKLVFCTVDGRVTMAEMVSGQRVWDIDLGMPVIAPISVDGEGVYVGAHRGEILKLDFFDGRTAWSVRLDGPIKGGPSIVGDIVVFPTLNHHVFFVDKKGGKIILDYPTFGMVSSRPAICSDRVYVAGEDENLYCFLMLREK